MPNLNQPTYTGAIAAFEKATAITAGSGSCFAKDGAQARRISTGDGYSPIADSRNQVTQSDLSELAAKLTAQEAMEALTNLKDSEEDRINKTLRGIHGALLARFERPHKTPEIMARHPNLKALSQDPEYIGTYEIHERLYRALEAKLLASS